MKTQIIVSRILEIKHADDWTEEDLRRLAEHLTTNENIDEWDIKLSNIKEVFKYSTILEKNL